jgi:hypothetical protein
MPTCSSFGTYTVAVEGRRRDECAEQTLHEGDGNEERLLVIRSILRLAMVM